MNLPVPLVLAGAAVAGLSAYALAPARGVGTGPAAVPPVVAQESGAAPSPARKWVDEVFAANARELERLVFAENALPEPDTSKLEILLLRWGEREPARCLESLPLLRSPEEFRELLIGDWASRDPHAAVEWFVKSSALLPEGQVSPFAEMLARLVPDKRLADLVPAGDSRDRVSSAILQRLAETDLPAALKELGEPTAAGALNKGEAVIGSWFAADPVAALAWIRRVQGERNQAMLRLAAATATGPRDPAAAVKLLASDPILRDGWSAHLASWFAEWGKQDAAGALQWLRESRDADLPKEEILTSFLRERKADTVGPLLAAAGLSEAEIVERARFMDGNGEPGEWWAEVQHLAPGPVRDALLTKAATRVLQSCGGRPDLLTDVLAEAGDPAARVALETAIREQSDEDRWQVLTDPSLPVTPEGVYKLATQRPRETAEALLQRPDSTPEQWQHLAAGWAEVDAPDAAQWLTKQPDSPVVRKAIVSLAARWAVSDPAAASAWLATMPDSPVRDEAVVELVGHLDGPRVEPDAALHWALTITDASLRDQVLEGAFRRWVAVDPEAAAKALQSAGNVPVETRNHLMENAGIPHP